MAALKQLRTDPQLPCISVQDVRPTSVRQHGVFTTKLFLYIVLQLYQNRIFGNK